MLISTDFMDCKKVFFFSQQFPNGILNFGSLENRKNQGNQRNDDRSQGRNDRNQGRNDRNQGRTDRNTGRHDKNQIPHWAVWNQDSNYDGNSAGNSSQEFGRGFGRNPDWLQQQPSGYSRSSSQDTGYNSLPNSYGNYNSYDNYK